MLIIRGIRGAITVDNNTEEDILAAAEDLFKKVIEFNSISDDEIVSIVFTATDDLDQAYPARAVREMGYNRVPLMCYQEMRVVSSLERCLRVIVYINRDCSLTEIKHVYLREAKLLRPDLVQEK